MIINLKENKNISQIFLNLFLSYTEKYSSKTYIIFHWYFQTIAKTKFSNKIPQMQVLASKQVFQSNVINYYTSSVYLYQSEFYTLQQKVIFCIFFPVRFKTLFFFKLNHWFDFL